MNISAPFIIRPIATALLMVGLTILGGVAYTQLRVAPLPEIDYPTIQVTAPFPGTSPEVMASSVAAPLERQFAQISAITQLTSSSGVGATTIAIQFDLSRNIDAAAQDVQAAIDAAAAQLPKNMPAPPTYKKTNPADAPVMILALTSTTLPLTVVQKYADNIVGQQISQIEGVALVVTNGALKPAVRIEANPIALAGRKLSLEDVRSAVVAATLNGPKGTLTGPRQGYIIENNDQLFTAATYRPVIVAWRNGSPVRLADVADVVDGPEDLHGFNYANGTPAIVLRILRQPGANVVNTVERIRAALPRLQASIPPTIDIHIQADRTETIRASLNDVQFTLVVAICLVVVVIFLFLRNLPATTIPGVTVPLSLIGTSAAIYAFGYGLDNLSLMGLTIATGFVVDDAVVEVENIYRHIERGLPPLQAALKGSGEIRFTVMSISTCRFASGRSDTSHRRYALRCVRTAQDRPVLHPAEQLLGGARSRPTLPARSQCARFAVCRFHQRGPGANDCAGRTQTDGPLADGQPSGPVSGHHAIVQSRSRRGTRAGGRRDQPGQAQAQRAGHVAHHVPRQCPGIPRFAQDSTAADPGFGDRRLPHPRDAVRESGPSDHDSFNDPVGWRGGATHTYGLPL
jgi:multidrug efflux pump subunit AcrB